MSGVGTRPIRVAFYPSCTGIEPHFGHIYCGFANWLLAQQIGAEFWVLAAKGFSMPFHSPQNWAQKFALLDLPKTRIEIMGHAMADEMAYQSIEDVASHPDVESFTEPCSVHQGIGYFTLRMKNIWIRVLMTPDYKEGMGIRDFPILAMGDSSILARVYGVTDMIDGNDISNSTGTMSNSKIALIKKLFPDLCGPEIHQRYIPVIVDHKGNKIGSSPGNDADYRIRPLLEKYGRDNLLALAFSALQPWKWTWWPNEVSLNWMVQHFDIEQLPDPEKPIQIYNRDPAKYGWQDGLFQKVTFL